MYYNLGTDLLLRSKGGSGFWRGGGTILKQAPFEGGGEREGGQMLWHSKGSLLNRIL